MTTLCDLCCSISYSDTHVLGKIQNARLHSEPALWILKYTLFKHEPLKWRGKSKWKIYSGMRTHRNYDRRQRVLLMFHRRREKVTLSLLLVGIPTIRASGTVTMLHTGANSGEFVPPTRTCRAQNYFKFFENDQASCEQNVIYIIVNKQLSTSR